MDHRMRLDITKVEQVIETKGLRKRWVAEQIAVHPNTFYAYLKGQRHPSRSMIRLMAIVLGVTETDIAA